MLKIKLLGSLCICSVVLFFLMQATVHASEDAPFITDDEEYAVMAAALFPDTTHSTLNSNEPARKDPSYRFTTRLDGIPSDYFRLSRLTTSGSLPDKGLARTMIDDFNRKNAQEHQIDPAKFAAVSPKGDRVTLITPKRFSMEDEPKEDRSGITYISRPGFDSAKTGAVLQVSHVAGYEMGIGYQVILEKSPRNGKWSIVDAVINRRY